MILRSRHRQLLLIASGLLCLLLFYFAIWRRAIQPGKTELKSAEDAKVHSSLDSLEAEWLQEQDRVADRNFRVDFSSLGATSSTEQRLVHAGLSLSDQWGSVLFTVVNDAYLDLAHSWLCNTAPFPHLHRQVLFLATDADTGQQLSKRWPNVTVVVMEKAGEEYKGNQDYSHAGYVRLMVDRTRVIHRMLKAKVRVFLFEVDFVWLRNPLPYVFSRSKHADIVGVTVYGTKKICGCFLYLKPTYATLKLWSKLTEEMEELGDKIAKQGRDVEISEDFNDQVFLSRLLAKNYGGVMLARLPEALFPEGIWYKKEDYRRTIPSPIVIHNNWITGNPQKINRAKEFGHWFLRPNSNAVACDVEQVRKVVRIKG